MASRPSNEEVIENLTKDFDDTTIARDDDSRASGDSPSPDPSNCSEINDDTEIIDEASLQERDSLLSDEEKENLRLEAIEHKIEGNTLFKQGEFMDSVISYTKALQKCPLPFKEERSVFYANRAACKHKLKRNESAIADCTKALELNASYVKAYLRRAALYEETEKLDEALDDYKKVLEFDSENREARSASMRLPAQINERNEKLKTEMFAKLKDLGNTVLKPFGLSTNNFKMTQDPNSGGYSINFVQNQ